MAKKLHRTPEQKRFRAGVLKEINELRSKWKEWRDIAYALYKSLQNDESYKKAKKWIFTEKDKRTADDFDELLKWLSSKDDEKISNLKLKALCEILKSEELTKQQYDNLKIELKEMDLRKKGPLWYDFWKMGFQKLSQTDKEDIFLSKFNRSMPDDYLPILENLLKKTNDKKFVFYMFRMLVDTWTISKVSKETEDVIIKMLFADKDSINRVVKMFLTEFKYPDNYKESFDYEVDKYFENLPSWIKEIMIPVFSDFDYISSFIHKMNRCCTSEAFLEILKTLNIKIPRELAKKIEPERRSDLLNEIIVDRLDMDTVKEFIKNMLDQWYCGKKDIERLEDILFDEHYCSFLSMIDDKYKTPRYLNPCMRFVTNWISKEEKINLLKQLKENNCNEKYDKNILLIHDFREDDTLVDYNDWLINLIVDTVSLNKKNYPTLLYRDKQKQWKIDKDVLEKWIEAEEKHVSISDVRNIIQDVYSLENDDLIREMVKHFSYLNKICTESEMNVLIKKFIHIMTDKDVELFKSIMNRYWTTEWHYQPDGYTIPASMLLYKLKYFVWGWVEVPSWRYMDWPIPKDVYLDALEKWIIKYPNLPKNIMPAEYIDPQDYEKVANLMHADMARIQKEIEDTENLKKEARDNWEKGGVEFNFTKQEQKFVLSVDREKRCLKFLTENLGFHVQIHKKYVKDGFCVWGWRVEMNEKDKTIYLYWASIDYWSVPNEYREAMKKMLEKIFPDYKILL